MIGLDSILLVSEIFHIDHLNLECLHSWIVGCFVLSPLNWSVILKMIHTCMKKDL